VTRPPADRSHLSIGEVLSLLQGEFPDVTISKIRFLESQGLLDPERTPSGYRKFYEGDIDRLRWILRQQKDHYLPLKVIKDRLDDAGPRHPAAPRAPATASPSPRGPAEHNGAVAPATGAPGPPVAGQPPAGVAALAVDERPAPGPAPPAVADARQVDPAPPDDVMPAQRSAPARSGANPATAAASRVPSPEAQTAAGARGRLTRPSGRSHAADAGSVSLTADELAQASGLTGRDVRDLERYGLIDSFAVGDATYYDADSLVIARTAAGFLQHGIEARHMRSYKVAVDREAGLFEQIVLPLLKQRNPDAKRRATQTVAELMRLGDDLRTVLLRRELRDHIPPTSSPS
jgi:DNA-binding transcriptional MerR regulator